MGIPPQTDMRLLSALAENQQCSPCTQGLGVVAHRLRGILISWTDFPWGVCPPPGVGEHPQKSSPTAGLTMIYTTNDHCSPV